MWAYLGCTRMVEAVAMIETNRFFSLFMLTGVD